MTRQVSMTIDGVGYRVTPDVDAVERETGARPGGITPPDQQRTPMTPDTDPQERPFPPMGRFEKHLTAPPQIMGCERIPFLALTGVVAFLAIIFLGIGHPVLSVGGLISCALFFPGGLRWLRAMSEYDPHWFAMRWLGMTWPRHLPDEHPPAWLTDCAFIGYDDPPTTAEVVTAWVKVLGAIAIPAILTGLVFGALAGGGVFTVLLTAVLLWVFTEDSLDVLRAITGRHGR